MYYDARGSEVLIAGKCSCAVLELSLSVLFALMNVRGGSPGDVDDG